MKLKELLNKKSKEELLYSSDIYNIKPNMKKNEIVEYLNNKILNKEFVESIFYGFLLDENNLLNKLIDNKGSIDLVFEDCGMEVYYFEKLFFIALEDIDSVNVRLVIPEDLLEIIKKSNYKKVDTSRLDKVYDLLLSMINYYGVVSFDDLEETYKKYYNEELKIDDSVLNLENHYFMMKYYTIDDKEYYVNTIMEDFESLSNAVIERQRIIDRKEIDLNDLLKYKDHMYYENNEDIEMLKGFISKYFPSELNVFHDDSFISFIMNSFKISINELYTILDMVESYEVDIREQADDFIQLLLNVYDNAVLWINNGWKSTEFIQEFGKEKFVDFLEMPHDECDCGCDHEHEHKCHCEGEHECKCSHDHKCNHDHECNCHHDE